MSDISRSGVLLKDDIAKHKRLGAARRAVIAMLCQNITRDEAAARRPIYTAAGFDEDDFAMSKRAARYGILTPA